ncbi:MAG TPA: ATP-binding protein [Vicinamibacterales bacterium]|jgi:two-component system NtrC family sensor kinase|nr:ATP-binding protein [Vicinamibacterales bacterium]
MLRRPPSLRTRLALLITLAVAIIISVQAVIEISIFERGVERDVRENARLTALAVADDFELRRDPIDIDALARTLREFAIGAPSIRTVSVVSTSGNTGTVIASTASVEREEAIGTAVAAATRHETISVDPSPISTIVAVPAVHDGQTVGAAVVTASMGSVSQLRTKGRTVTLWFAPAVVVLLTFIIDLFVRRLIHRPIARIHETMRLAGAGDFSARAPIVHQDEIGEVAAGLNEMLRRLQELNDALQERVDAATAELRLKNQELVESYQRVFALREALGRAEQMAAIGQTAASMAHQVGTPLNLISGYVQMLQEDRAMDPKAARRLAIVQEQIGKVASVVRTMLDNARRPDTRWAVSVSSLLSRVADVARPKLDMSKIALALDASPALPPIEANTEELELAILNLVNNSLDAMPDGGRLTITARTADSRVRIEISDTGRGIDPGLLPRIFDPWVTTKPPGRGTGLGLSITRDVISRHGGTITAESRPGRTAFTIDLPAAPAEPHQEE